MRTEIVICPLTNAAIDDNPDNKKLPFKSALVRREPVKTRNRYYDVTDGVGTNIKALSPDAKELTHVIVVFVAGCK